MAELTPSQITAVRKLLADDAGSKKVAGVTSLGHEHAPVFRVSYDDGRSVVVKTPRPENTSHPFGAGEAFRREVAGLGLAQGSAAAATLIGYDEAASVLVIEDVGDRTLDAVIRGSDREAAQTAMSQYGAALGRLHATTSKKQRAYVEARERLGAVVSGSEAAGTWRGIDNWAGIVTDCAALSLPDAQRAHDDIAWLGRALHDSTWAALAHGDPSPWNTHFRPEGSAVFVDFEGATFGHIGLDLSWIHYPFTNCSDRWSILLADVSDIAESAYRDALVQGVPAAADDDSFRLMRAVGAAAALLVRMQRLPLLDRNDQDAYDSWRRRTQLVHQLDVFTALAEAGRCLAAFTDWCAELSSAMRSRWADCANPAPPVFAAFAA